MAAVETSLCCGRLLMVDENKAQSESDSNRVESTEISVPDSTGVSGLAMLAVLCSVMVFCPLTPLAGLVLGIAALRSIRNDPRKRGRDLAIVAVIFGAVFTIGWPVAIAMLVKSIERKEQAVLAAVDMPLQAGFAGDSDGFLAAFATESDRTPEMNAQVRVFFDDLRQRYGEYRSCKLDPEGPSKHQPAFALDIDPRPAPAELTFRYLLSFDRSQTPATVLFEPSTDADDARLTLQGIIVEDLLRESLTYPPGFVIPLDPSPELENSP